MILFSVGSLSHAEMLEDILEGFIGCDVAACDFTKVGEGDAKVFCKEVAVELVVETIDDS